jgi:valyl-tRNA synthetase
MLLHFLLERFLILFYPIIPQITSTIAKECGLDLHKEEFPKAKKGKSDLELIRKIMEFNSEDVESKERQRHLAQRKHWRNQDSKRAFDSLVRCG